VPAERLSKTEDATVGDVRFGGAGGRRGPSISATSWSGSWRTTETSAGRPCGVRRSACGSRARRVV